MQNDVADPFFLSQEVARRQARELWYSEKLVLMSDFMRYPDPFPSLEYKGAGDKGDELWCSGKNGASALRCEDEPCWWYAPLEASGFFMFRTLFREC